MNVRDVEGPHDRPTATEMVTAVREWLDLVAAGEAEPNRFHARVAANMLTMVERQAEIGEQIAVAHAERLARLGVANDAELAAKIRAGELDDRVDEMRQAVLDSVRDKLRVANPRYLAAVDSSDLLSPESFPSEASSDEA